MFFSVFVLLSELLFGYVFFGIKIYDIGKKKIIKVSLPMLIVLIGYILFCLTQVVWFRRIVIAYIIYELICIKIRIGEEKY